MRPSESTAAARPAWWSGRGRFLLVAAGLYGRWLLAYEGCPAPNGRVDAWLAQGVARGGIGLLQALGFGASRAPGSPLLVLDGLPAVVVGAPCDSLALYALCAGFVLAYPGPWRVRLWFLPLRVVWAGSAVLARSKPSSPRKPGRRERIVCFMQEKG